MLWSELAYSARDCHVFAFKVFRDLYRGVVEYIERFASDVDACLEFHADAVDRLDEHRRDVISLHVHLTRAYRVCLRAAAAHAA